ncbi:MAG TPA: acyltransferase [Burkholderiaceae bacterium]|nr:acyltransferase [Burkholderiaceae bacterium]
MSAIASTTTPSAWAANTATAHERLDTVQALRAVAALSVVGMHIPAIDRGAFGVDLFFVISGFIVCHVAAADPGRFIVKRLIRVVPLYWLCTLALFAVAMVAPHLMGATRADWSELVKSLAFVPFMKSNGNVHPVLYLGWTLNYEMLFYALFALSLLVAPQRPQWVAAPLLFALIALGQLVTFDSVPLRFWSAPILIEFVYGMVAYRLWRSGALADLRPGFAVPLALSAMVLMVLLHPDDAQRSWQWGVPALIVFVATLSLESRWRVPAWWLLIGNASYSLYLTQAYVLQAIQKKVMPLDAFTPAKVATMVAAVLACCAVAVLFFKLIERPSNLWLRRRLLRKRLPMRAASASRA